MPLYTPAADLAANFSAKGDLLAGTGAQAYTNLASGTDGYYLKANSATSTGLEWAAVSASATQVDRASGALGDYVVRQKITADTYYRITLDISSGGYPEMLLGYGAATPDTRMYRYTLGTIGFSDANTGNPAGMHFGPEAANSSMIDITANSGTTGISSIVMRGGATATSGVILDLMDKSGDSVAGFRASSGNGVGTIELGPGGATARDVRIRRSTTKTLIIDDNAAGSLTTVDFKTTNLYQNGSPISATATQVDRASGSAGDYVARIKLTADTQYRLIAELRASTSEPEILFGPGSTTAPDVRLARSAAGTLTLDNNAGGTGVLIGTGISSPTATTLSVYAGNSASSGSSNGANITIKAGDVVGTSVGIPGTATFRGGDASTDAEGGQVIIEGGTATVGGNLGGPVTIRGGTSSTSGGSSVYIQGGDGDGTAQGGGNTLVDGGSGAGSGSGGNAVVTGGIGGVTGPGGYASIQGGSGAGTGTSAYIIAYGNDATSGHGKLSLRTNDSLGANGYVLTADGSGYATWAAVSASATQVDRASGAAGDYLAKIKLTADTQYRLVTELRSSTSEPQILFGTGGTTAPDARLTRYGAGQIQLDDNGQSQNVYFRVMGKNGGWASFQLQQSGDTTQRIEMTSYDGPKIGMGPGNAGNDIRIKRTGTKTLTIDDGASGAITFSVVGTMAAGPSGAQANIMVGSSAPTAGVDAPLGSIYMVTT